MVTFWGKVITFWGNVNTFGGPLSLFWLTSVYYICQIHRSHNSRNNHDRVYPHRQGVLVDSESFSTFGQNFVKLSTKFSIPAENCKFCADLFCYSMSGVRVWLIRTHQLIRRPQMIRRPGLYGQTN